MFGFGKKDVFDDSLMDDYMTEEDELTPADVRKGGNGFWKGFALGALLVAVIFIASIGLFMYNLISGSGIISSAPDNVLGENFTEKTETIKGIIDYYYLDEVKDQDLVDGMYGGMVAALDDPYSVYYPEAEYSSMMDSTSGSYAGIGALISQNLETGEITITRPFDDSPASKAGLLPGDVVLAVDGVSTEGEDLANVTAKIKGEDGTKVVLTISRNDETMDVEVTRGYVEVTTVNGFMVDDTIGYMAILEFDLITVEQYEKVLADLQSQGMKKLIIDLRDNPGGNLAVVTDILDKILPEGMIVYTEDKRGEGEQFTSDEEHQLKMDMVVLVNENSASASEIFAGAIQDHKWGTLVGTNTFGKGIVQRVFPLGDGTAVKITVSKYFTPSGRDIHKTGIAPDVVVEIPEEAVEDGEITDEEDSQYQEAIRILREK